MDLTVLGRYAPFAPAGGACSGYLLHAGDTHVLVDCGNGVVSRLQAQLPVERLTAVVLTHFHPDHFADLHSLRYLVQAAQRQGRRSEPVVVYGPSRPRSEAYRADWEAGHAWVKAPGLVEFRGYDPRQALPIGDFTVTFARTIHAVPAYALRFEAGGRSFFFSADSRLSPKLTALARGVNLALVEASLLERDGALRRLGHMTAIDAANLAAASGAGRLLLTHLYPDYDPAALQAEAKAVFTATEVAEEGRTYPV